MKGKTKPSYSLWQNTGYMVGLAWKERKSVLWLVLLLALVTVLGSVAELLVAPLVLQRVEAKAPLADVLSAIAGFTFVLMLLHGLRGYIETNTLFGRIELRDSLTARIMKKTMTTSYPNTEDPAVLKLQKKARMATNSNQQATEAIWDTLSNLLRDLLGFAVYLFLLSSLKPALLLVVLAATVISFFASKRINEWGYRHHEEEAGYEKKMDYVSELAQDIPLAKDIRIFGMRPWLEEVYAGAQRLFRDFGARRERVYFWADFIDLMLSLLRNGVTYAYLIAVTLREGLPASEFLLYFSAVNGFATWVTGILSGCSTLHQQSLDISLVREYIELPEQFHFEEGRPLRPTPGKAYELRLENVTFRYPGAESDTIHQMNLTIHPGEKLAIVGLNGAGKTTLVKLLCGFYDPTEGRVLLDGEDIRQYNRRDYYTMFSAVFQQFSVLEVTAAENVAQTDGEIDAEKLWSCIDRAGLTEKIQSLPQREQTHIGRKVYLDGVELSGGQMQRLMLARALYKDAPILVLDEPTAALDPLAENDIYQKYNSLTTGRTSVFISHRLASTRFCDRVLFLEQGVIAEEGTHESLLAAGGKYAQLFAVQSKYYQEGEHTHEKEEF